jgi:thiamine-monophosphate kinase
MSTDEFGLIRKYFRRDAHSDGDGVLLGIGDDAAVIAVDGRAAVTTDTLVAGVHFLDSMPPDALGHRALAVNLSDLAAMGASPRWCTLALTLPRADEEWLAAFARGLFALADRHAVALIGGDLTRGPLSVTIQLIGTVGEHWLARGGAHPGDDIWVTGTLGDSAAGLAIVKESASGRSAAHAALAERFHRPTPRVREGLALVGLASAAIDVSDGLLADLGHICSASGCAAMIDVEHLPRSAELLSVFPPRTAETFALSGGDDYELCFTAPSARAAAIDAAFEPLGAQAHRIGEVVAGGTGEISVCRGGEPFTPAARGFAHF